MDGGTIAAAAIGGVLGFLFLVAAIILWYKHRSKCHCYLPVVGRSSQVAKVVVAPPDQPERPLQQHSYETMAADGKAEDGKDAPTDEASTAPPSVTSSMAPAPAPAAPPSWDAPAPAAAAPAPELAPLPTGYNASAPAPAPAMAPLPPIAAPAAAPLPPIAEKVEKKDTEEGKEGKGKEDKGKEDKGKEDKDKEDKDKEDKKDRPPSGYRQRSSVAPA